MGRLQGDNGPPMLVVPLRATAPEACRASGWGMMRGCVSPEGRIVCPICTRPVVARRDAALGDAVRVIGDHDRA